MNYNVLKESKTCFCFEKSISREIEKGIDSLSARNCLVYAVLGVAFLVTSLAFAYSSISLESFVFGSVIRYNLYLTLLAFVFVAAGGFCLFRAGQSKPPSSVLRKTLVEQVKAVKDNQ